MILNELQGDKKTYTGRYFKGVITYVTDYAQKDGYVVFSFRKADWRYQSMTVGELIKQLAKYDFI